ncbi:MAG: hypothetical protein VX089_03955 [Pseudomonadota bacterium]|nr:hypothetical protein [Pseudomonadota bacterium]
MKTIFTIIIIFLTTLVLFTFVQKKILLNFLDIKGTIINLEETVFEYDSRKIKKVKLLHSYLGDINLAISFPKNYSKEVLPVLFILGGIETGLNSVKHVSDIGNNILVGFDWPISNNDLVTKENIPNFKGLFKKVFNSPKQAAVAIEWVSKQIWAEDRISLLGFSIGSIVAPSVQRLLENRNNVKIKFTVLAYGGTNIGLLINTNPYIKPKWLKPFLGWFTQIIFNPIEPKQHLPHISGNFLIINGKEDNLIPLKSSLLMQELTPFPKKIILLDGEHMGVGKQQKALLKTIIEKTRKWLNENNAINKN